MSNIKPETFTFNICKKVNKYKQKRKCKQGPLQISNINYDNVTTKYIRTPERILNII